MRTVAISPIVFIGLIVTGALLYGIAGGPRTRGLAGALLAVGFLGLALVLFP